MQHPITRRHALGTVAALSLGTSALPSAHAAEGVIRVGQVLPLSGPVGDAVKLLIEGQNAAFADVNAKGGVNGSRVEIITLDDAFDGKKTVEQVNVLLNEHKVTCLFGLATGPGIGATLPILMQRQVPLVTVYNGADQLRAKHHPYFFTATASFNDEMRQMIRNLTTVKSNRIAVAIQGNDFGRANLAMIEALAKEYGATLVGHAELNMDGTKSEEALKKLSALNPQAILLLSAGMPVLNFLKVASSSVRIPIYTMSMAGSSVFLKMLGSTAAGLGITQIVPYPWRQTNTLVRNFKASMERNKLEMSYDRMAGYLNATVLIEALKRAGKNPSGSAIVAAIENMGELDLGGYRLNFSRTNHHGSNFVELSMVGKDGRYFR